jgi:predicted small lipoprotein YifL
MIIHLLEHFRSAENGTGEKGFLPSPPQEKVTPEDKGHEIFCYNMKLINREYKFS